MKRPKTNNILVCIFVLVAFTGCASPIARPLRQETAPEVTFAMVFANPDAYQGDTVIWGGSIIRTVNTKQGSRIFILQTSLGLRDRPEAVDTSEGRFIAVTDRFIEPLVYKEGRMITVAGKVAGKKTVVHKKTGISYTYPLVQVEQLHLWKESEPIQSPYWDPYWEYDPFWDFSFYREFEREGDEGREFRGRRDEDRGESREHEEGHDRR
jgi:outer membrane lipoprotein